MVSLSLSKLVALSVAAGGAAVAPIAASYLNARRPVTAQNTPGFSLGNASDISLSLKPVKLVFASQRQGNTQPVLRADIISAA